MEIHTNTNKENYIKVHIQTNYLMLLYDNILLARAAALQSVAVRWSLGNDVVATISAIIIFFSPPPFHQSPSRHFLIDRVLGSRNLFSKS